jgi:multiple sugar transport system ATP-binding protein
MVARISAESEAREGHKMRLVLDSSKIHLFDPNTEEAIF